MLLTGAITVFIILVSGTTIAVAVVLRFLFRYFKRAEDVGWELGVSYLVKEKGFNKRFLLFQKLIASKDDSGMVITRTFPGKIRKNRGFEAMPIWWLSREESPNSIDPLSLAKLTHVIQDFIQNKEEAVILLDGLEYLILQNNFETTLRFLQALNDLVILNRATLIVPVDPSSLSEKQLSLLEKEMETHRLSMSILRFFGE